jgi:hypothetical protein
MNWTQLIIVSVLAIALVAFLIIQNRKDEKVLENNLNNDYPISLEEKNISDVDELDKNVH